MLKNGKQPDGNADSKARRKSAKVEDVSGQIDTEQKTPSPFRSHTSEKLANSGQAMIQ